MDVSLPSIPRLRISRFSPQSDNQALTPVAGPSHNSDFLHADDDDEDAESTPRMNSTAMPDRQSPRNASAPGLPADTPAARLRALLARVPNTPDSATPHASTSRMPALPSGSEPESDFEPPYSSVTTSSVARESLKEIFSRALREPGNTPQKGKQRRNSIDTSEVEASPRVEEERSRYRGKRRSLSDEEAEKSKYAESSERSFRSSSAASAFDALRQRLNGSASIMPTIPSEQLVMDMSMPPPNSSMDTAMPPPAPADTSSETPPYATSTPMRTFQMSAHLHMQSNLLDQDSEMRNALEGMDSYDVAPVPQTRQRTTSLRGTGGPSPRPQPQGPSPARPLSWSSHSKSHSIHNLPLIRRGSEDVYNSTSTPSSSRGSSSQSGADYKERQDEVTRDRMHERERGWNSPIPKSPAHPGRHDPSHRHSWGSPGSGRGSPAHGLSRKSSVASLTSTDDGRSSRASSVASRADHDERMHFLEQERSKEREREWNKPHPKLSRSSSSLSLNKSERLRTNSQPTRPDSAASYLSPNRLTLHRHASSNSLNSSRPSSPASSISGHSVELEVEHEIEHERERNWNSPHPKWNHPLHPRRSLSPLPRSPAGSPPPTQHRFTTTPRSRTNSTTKAPSPSVPPSGKSVAKEWIARPKSPLLRSTADNKPSPHTRPLSPSGPPSRSKTDSSEAGFKSRFGWSFPQKTPLPPLELDQDSPQKALSRRPSRASLTASPSHIPVPSPKKSVRDTSASAANQAEKKKSHRRSVTELAESIGAIPPRIHISDGGDAADELPPIPIVNGHDDLSSASEDESVVHTSTPTARPIPLPPLDATHTPNLLTSAANDHALHNEEAQPRSSTPLVSPPPTPPTPGPATIFSLQTPPRRPQFHTPKAVFETPPPPRGMPDLPGPPSSEDEADHTPVMQSNDIPANVTSLKTPRPPGAWLATPAPSRQPSKDPVERAGSAPPAELQLSSSDTGLATPSSTLSRANSLPLQTPAPPGGWINTPGVPDTSARRKGLLKVRFDVESETASEGTIERPSADSSVESKNPDTELPNASWSAIALQNGDASISTAPADQSSADAAPVPAPSPLRDRIRQRSPSIRVLDAYGREQVETESAPPAVHEAAPQGVDPPTDGRAVTPPTPHREARVATVATPRSQSVVRMVDAMGREIEEPVPEEDSFANPPLSRSEALYRMRETLSSMAQEMSDADRPSDKAVFDARSYASLEERCKAAQVARSKISKSLQMAQSAEVELKSRYAPLREKMKPSALLPDPRRFGWRLVVAFILLQAIILVVLYRYSLVQARKIFLTTYYDPFYPELYRYLVKPDTTLHTIPQCPSWSIFTVFSSLQRAGLRGVGEDAWTSVKCAVSSYIQTFWVDLNYAQNTVTHS